MLLSQDYVISHTKTNCQFEYSKGFTSTISTVILSSIQLVLSPSRPVCVYQVTYAKEKTSTLPFTIGIICVYEGQKNFPTILRFAYTFMPVLYKMQKSISTLFQCVLRFCLGKPFNVCKYHVLLNSAAFPFWVCN